MRPVSDLLDIDDIRAAERAHRRHVLRTPTVPSPGLSAHLGVPVTLKLELLQRTGSFKPRGALQKMLALTAARARGRRRRGQRRQPRHRGRRRRRRAGRRGDRGDAAVGAAAVGRGVPGRRRHGAAHARHAGAFALLGRAGRRGRDAGAPVRRPGGDRRRRARSAGAREDAPTHRRAGQHRRRRADRRGGHGVAGALPGVRVWGVETEGADAMSRALAAGAPVAITPTSIVTTL